MRRVNNKSKTYSLGQFIPGEYGIKEAQKDIEELRAKYGGANYTFEQDIKQQIKIEEEIELQQQLTTLTEKNRYFCVTFEVSYLSYFNYL